MTIMASRSTIAVNILSVLDEYQALSSEVADLLNLNTRKLLTAILDSDEMISEVTQHSYYHSNGFKKIVLFQGGKDKGEIRLHEWAPGDGSQIDRHNHPWNFVSQVLQGVLENQIFHETEGSQFERTLVAPVGGGRDGYTFIPDGLASLALDFAVSLAQSGVYFARHNLIHNAFSRAGAITLMVQGPFVRESTLAYRCVGSSAREAKIIRLAKSDVTTTLERAIKCLL